MPIVKRLRVADLMLDPKNFRHMPQKTEDKAIHAMAALDSKYFWGLAQALLEKGYVEVENIVVLKSATTDRQLLVREGNRRIAILKLALGLLKGKGLEIPEHISRLLGALPPSWKTKNSEVPCLVFESTEAEGADNVVDWTHGKDEQAGRLEWNAVARARHNRERNQSSEPSLDLLEKYIHVGTNLSADEKEQWSAAYSLSILVNAMNVVHERLGFKSNRELADAYPKIAKYRGEVDNVIRDIGRGKIITDDVRSADFGVAYGIPQLAVTPALSHVPGGPSTLPSPSTLAVAIPTAPLRPKKIKAVASNTQVSVRRNLRKLVLRGNNRDKIVSLKDEALHLMLEWNPLSFCFVLRSMFELSAKAYCEDHKSTGGPAATKGSDDRKLGEILKDIYAHMEKLQIATSPNGKPDAHWRKRLHGAMAELLQPNSLFSITSLNQLLHSSTFSLSEKHICIVFSNVFPMLEELNR